MADLLFDLCVVGAGILGSAAARHASLKPGVRVCLIGPDEPNVSICPSIFACVCGGGVIPLSLSLSLSLSLIVIEHYPAVSTSYLDVQIK